MLVLVGSVRQRVACLDHQVMLAHHEHDQFAAVVLNAPCLGLLLLGCCALILRRCLAPRPRRAEEHQPAEVKTAGHRYTAVHDEPILEAISDEPELLQTTVEEPLLKTLIKEPLLETLIKEPLVETLIKEPLVEAIVEEPLLETLIKEPLVEAIVDEPLLKTIIKKPLLETISEEPFLEVITEEPLTDPVGEEPILEAPADTALLKAIPTEQAPQVAIREQDQAQTTPQEQVQKQIIDAPRQIRRSQYLPLRYTPRLLGVEAGYVEAWQGKYEVNLFHDPAKRRLHIKGGEEGVLTVYAAVQELLAEWRGQDAA